MDSQLADNVAGETIHEDAFAWSQRTINTTAEAPVVAAKL